MATAKGKITASNMVPGTIVRIVKESDATAELFERKPEWTAARIKRDSTLAEIVENIPMGNGRRKIVTKFGEFVVVGHQTFLLAKDGETADEPEAVQADIVEQVSKWEMPEVLTVTGEEPIEATRIPAATFTISEEEIEENAAVKLADTIRRDEEAPGVENIDAPSVAWIAEREEKRVTERARMEATARETIMEAERIIRELSLPAVDLHSAMENLQTASAMLDGETPWEAFRIAKRTAEMWPRVQRLRGEFEAAPEWRKERITAALATMGTVVYPEGTPEYTLYREELTEALDALKNPMPERWRIQFERIGRTHNPKPLDYLSTDNPEEVLARIQKYVGRFLVSREFRVTFEGNRIEIDGGRFGSGTCTPLES